MHSKSAEHSPSLLDVPDLTWESELTPREEEIMQWIALGKTNGEIGLILEISHRTVAKHVEHINIKLGTKSRTEAVVQYLLVYQQRR